MLLEYSTFPLEKCRPDGGLTLTSGIHFREEPDLINGRTWLPPTPIPPRAIARRILKASGVCAVNKEALGAPANLRNLGIPDLVLGRRRLGGTPAAALRACPLSVGTSEVLLFPDFLLRVRGCQNLLLLDY